LATQFREWQSSRIIPDTNDLPRVPYSPVVDIAPIVARPPSQPGPALAADELGCSAGDEPGSGPPPPLREDRSVPIAQPEPSPVDGIEHILQRRIGQCQVGIASREINQHCLAGSSDQWGRLFRVKALTGGERWEYTAQKRF
jgi:hypothetical protein